MKGKKFDDKKTMWHLLPFKQLKEVVEVLTFGANKYGEDDWKYFVSTHNNYKRYLSACFRHIVEWKLGEKNDKETKKHHLAHAICCLLFIFWNDTRREK